MIQPCHNCKSTDIKTGDCGYSTFNVAWAQCNQCLLRVVQDCSDSAIELWNKYATDPIGEYLSQQRIEIKQKSVSTTVPKGTLSIEEFVLDKIHTLQHSCPAESLQ